MHFAASVTIIINSILITILIHLKHQLDFIDDCMKVIINNVDGNAHTETVAGTAAATTDAIELRELGFMMKTLIDLHVDVLQ